MARGKWAKDMRKLLKEKKSIGVKKCSTCDNFTSVTPLQSKQLFGASAGISRVTDYAPGF